MDGKPRMFTLPEAAKRYPQEPPPHLTSAWRHARKGLLARNGKRVRLEHVRAGGKIFIPEHALMRFFEELAEADQEYFDGNS